MGANRRLTASGVSTQNPRGEWVPAVPMPLFVSLGRKQCVCGEKFWTLDGYRGHFAYVHILGMES